MYNKTIVTIGILFLLVAAVFGILVVDYAWDHPDMTEARQAMNTFWWRAVAIVSFCLGGSLVKHVLDQDAESGQ